MKLGKGSVARKEKFISLTNLLSCGILNRKKDERRHIMELERISHDFSVCKVKDAAQIDLSQEFCFVGKTDEELSLVCPTDRVPSDTIEREDGWRAFRICGVLDFSLIGILAKIAAILAANQIGIFVVSTYNTDYVLVKAAQFKDAMSALEKEGYRIV